MKHKIIFSLLVCLSVSLLVNLLAGCARTVTSVVTYGSQMVVEVTLRGTMEISASRYFLILSTNPNFKVPLPPPYDITYELIEPGDTPRLGTAEAYYTNFYSTWNGYIFTEPGGNFLVSGPFVSGVTATRESLSTLGQATNKITFTFRLSQLFGVPVPTKLYFDFMTADWPVSDARLPADHLTSTNAYTSTIVGSTQTVTDDDNPELRGGLDIKECKVSIQ